MTAAAAISTAGLTKDYGAGHGLFELDLEVRQGEVFGFLGPNGAGKSTALRLLLGLIRPTAGSAKVLGLDTVGDANAIHRRVGFLPGDLALYPRITGRAVLDYLASLRGGVDRRTRDSLAERFDADLSRPVHELSTGNRQKLGLIQAFMHEPELVILDEPISGLDPLVQRSFHTLLREVSAEGRTVFLSSHTLSEVELSPIDWRSFGRGGWRSSIRSRTSDAWQPSGSSSSSPKRFPRRSSKPCRPFATRSPTGGS